MEEKMQRGTCDRFWGVRVCRNINLGGCLKEVWPKGFFDFTDIDLITEMDSKQSRCLNILMIAVLLTGKWVNISS